MAPHSRFTRLSPSPDFEAGSGAVGVATVHEGNDLDDEARAFYDKLQQARLQVKMTRNFHNSHVAQVRRVRTGVVARLFPIAGHAPWPQTVDMDDAEQV